MVKYVYDAWGNHKVLDASGQEITDPSHIGNRNPFRYRGYYYDTETGLYYLKARYYDPEVGRFISADDLSYINPDHVNGTNLYAYCYNNPVMNVDPEGTAWWHWVLAGVAVAGMAALSIVTAGLATTLAVGIAGAVIGGMYGGMVAAANGQDILTGIGIGALAGAFMSMGTAVAGEVLALKTLSLGARIFLSAGVMYSSGFMGGFLSDAMLQANNGDGKVNWKDAALTGVQWGALNVANGFMGAGAGELVFASTLAYNLFLNVMWGSIGLLIDVTKNSKKNKNANTATYAMA